MFKQHFPKDASDGDIISCRVGEFYDKRRRLNAYLREVANDLLSQALDFARSSQVRAVSERIRSSIVPGQTA